MIVRFERTSPGYMMFAAAIAIVLGLIMLWYPGGTMELMSAAFWVVQVILSIFVLTYTISECIYQYRAGHKGGGLLYLAIGLLVTVLIWLFSVGFVYMLIAIFLIIIGLAEIIGGFQMNVGKYFLIFLGLVNVMIGAIILRYPVALPLLIAWYVLFWGVSRLFFAFELKRMMKG